jgi:D-alanyl-lipoteichoic acid acyltransferase DltB (MBOAT superfamily)
MLFNSYPFVLVFLPAVLLGFALLTRVTVAPRVVCTYLTIVSLIFYAWWDWRYLALLGFSVAFNFGWGRLLQARLLAGGAAPRWRLALGIAVNLALLGYFKYANFFVDTANTLFGSGWALERVALPLAISFFTFEQVIYLVDTAAGRTPPHGFLAYAAFMTFFPRLISGPIVRPAEIVPQLTRPATFRFDPANVSQGLFIFAIGLAKKVLLADTFGAWVPAIFDQVSVVSFNDAWGAIVAFALQVYFDFSGYSDMAVGLALLFGIHLPENFDSPYQARSLIDFWRRWHMTLTRFLRDYLYIPLGGNRRGAWRHHANVMVTMMLGGLWHGANWTFVAWGAWHGFFLTVNHLWRAYARPLPGPLAWALTLLVFLSSLVLFRCHSFERIEVMFAGMAGLNGLWSEGAAHTIGGNRWRWLALGSGIVLFLPNRQAIVAWPWRSDLAYAATFAVLAGLSLLALGNPTPFFYFQF